MHSQSIYKLVIIWISIAPLLHISEKGFNIDIPSKWVSSMWYSLIFVPAKFFMAKCDLIWCWKLWWKLEIPIPLSTKIRWSKGLCMLQLQISFSCFSLFMCGNHPSKFQAMKLSKLKQSIPLQSACSWIITWC